MMRLTKYAQAAALLSRGSTLTSQAFTPSPHAALPQITRNLSLKSTTDEKRSQWSRPDLQGQSLIDETLTQMENDVDFQELAKQLQQFGKEGVARAERVKRREERAKRRRALDELGVPNFMKFVSDNDAAAAAAAAVASTSTTATTCNPVRNGKLYRTEPTILQLNIGLYCNQACSHCHVESSPLRKSETMSAEVAARCLTLLQNTPTVHTLDLTGGAPELNGQFRFLVRMAREWAKENKRELTIIDRCNLTVLLEPGQEDLVDFLKENRVKVVASLPCYCEGNVDAQRGRGVFERSIAALLKLNKAGYGSKDHPELELDLVYNPGGAFLPGPQSGLEADYKRELYATYGIEFNHLLTIANMPIKRFADFLAKEGKVKEYMELLVNSYNPSTVKGLMCLNTVSVGWTGALYDCDFNQQLGMDIIGDAEVDDDTKRQSLSVFDIEKLSDLGRYSVRTDNHCFGCTAGSGSSCSGAVA